MVRWCIPRDTTTTGKRMYYIEIKTKKLRQFQIVTNTIKNILKIISFQEYANTYIGKYLMKISFTYGCPFFYYIKITKYN